eukprot:15465229-Alexandrium_andersonii.AAC.1
MAHKGGRGKAARKPLRQGGKEIKGRHRDCKQREVRKETISKGEGQGAGQTAARTRTPSDPGAASEGR